MPTRRKHPARTPAAAKAKEDDRVQLVARIAPDLHALRGAIAQGLHHLPMAPEDIYELQGRLHVSQRRKTKLLVTLPQRDHLERIASQRNIPLWVVVSAALACVRNAPSGDRSAALAARRPARAAGDAP